MNLYKYLAIGDWGLDPVWGLGKDPEEEEKNKKIKFHSHFDSHFSSPAFVYYYLMRLNPYLQDLINYKIIKMKTQIECFYHLKA